MYQNDESVSFVEMTELDVDKAMYEFVQDTYPVLSLYADVYSLLQQAQIHVDGYPLALSQLTPLPCARHAHPYLIFHMPLIIQHHIQASPSQPSSSLPGKACLFNSLTAFALSLSALILGPLTSLCTNRVCSSTI